MEVEEEIRGRERKCRGTLARICLEEIKKRSREGRVGSDWEREKRDYYEERGMKVEEVKRRKENGEEWEEEIIRERRRREKTKMGKNHAIKL